MRHGSTNRRQRNRGGSGRRNNQQKMQVFDSNGPDVRIRGTAHQVTDKYLALAKDAASSGDTILSESYLQHAEHYQRIINSWLEQGVDSGDEKPQQDKRAKKSAPDDDLALPASILGKKPDVESQGQPAEATA